MMPVRDFEISDYIFNDHLQDEISGKYFVKENWPLVYILSDGKIKEAYVGETTDVLTRMKAHSKHRAKKKLTAVHLIDSHKFNKSATLDIESNLIQYMAGDGRFKLLNANLGLANHTYYQKGDYYWQIFVQIWNELRARGITEKSVETIENSDLFKYSPYKSLTAEQKDGLMIIMEALLDDKHENVIIEGGAGTGKTVMATFLFKLIYSDNKDFDFREFGDEEEYFISMVDKLKKKYPNPEMALVIPMSSFRNTIKRIFRKVKGLSANMVIGPSEVSKKKFDFLLVDESHRLRRRVNLTNYASFDQACERLNLEKDSCSELDWVIIQSKRAVLFYDDNQSIKPTDARKEDFDRLKFHHSTVVKELKSQMRVKGGGDYVQFVDKLLNSKMKLDTAQFASAKYELKLYESLQDMLAAINEKEQEHKLSRLIAGYSWEWISKLDKNKFDINIEGVNLRWNTVGDNWVNSKNATKEVGCIHTTQGYDLNYAGIIFGNEITYNKQTKKIEIIPANYYDRNGRNNIKSEEELRSYIINIYKTIMLRGIRGTFVYVCDQNLREYFSRYMETVEKKSQAEETTVSAFEILPSEEVKPYVNSIPLYDLQAAAGDFSPPQKVVDAEWISISAGHKASEDLFACRVIGESMNKIIPNNSVCLFRKYTGGSRQGKIVLVEHADIQDPDFAPGYTVKEYHSKKEYEAETWHHASITLKPLSYDQHFKEIVLKDEEAEYLKVIGEFVRLL